MEIEECEEIISQIDVELQTLDKQSKLDYNQKLRSMKDFTNATKKEVSDLLVSSDRLELLGVTSDQPYSDDDRQRLLSGFDRLEDGNRRLEDSHRVALNTEDVGTEILRNLRQQREQIEGTRSTLSNADSGVDKATNTLKRMIRHSNKQKLISWSIILTLILLILIVIWAKFIR